MTQFRTLQPLVPTAKGWLLVLFKKLMFGLCFGLSKPGAYVVQLNRLNTSEIYKVGIITPFFGFSLFVMRVPPVPSDKYELIVWQDGTDLRTHPEQPLEL